MTREQGRRRLRVVMVGLVGTAALVGIYMLLHTALFSARAVTVVGAIHETAAQVVQQAGLATHPPLLDINAGAAIHAIEQLPWVRSATVEVQWPDGVRITVHEEIPRLAMSLPGPGGRFAVLSARGRVLEVTPARPPGLLTFSVPAAAPGSPAAAALPAAGSTLGARDAVGLEVASTLPPSFVAQVTAVTVEPGGWVQLSMTTPIEVDIGTATQLPAKYEAVSSILAGATLHAGDVIDVSVPDAPTVTGP